MKSKIGKIFVVCILILSVSTKVYSSGEETDTFSGSLGSLFRQVWISIATIFENSFMSEDNETVFYDLSETSTGTNTGTGYVSQPSASSLTLYCETNQGLQHFAITDLGTSNELIWYGRNAGSSSNAYARKNFYATAKKNASTTSPGTKVAEITLNYGGHQNFTVIKSGGYYNIYTGSYGNNQGTGAGVGFYYRPKGMAITQVAVSTVLNATSTYTKTVDLESAGLNVGSILYAGGVNETQTAMVTVSGNATVWNLNSNNISSSTKVRSFSVSTGGVTPQGGCVSGDYLYLIGRNVHS